MDKRKRYQEYAALVTNPIISAAMDKSFKGRIKWHFMFVSTPQLVAEAFIAGYFIAAGLHLIAAWIIQG